MNDVTLCIPRKLAIYGTAAKLGHMLPINELPFRGE